MRFERNDRVRLLSEESGVPAHTEGTVLGFKHETRVYIVQFAEYGTHEIPEASVEQVEAD
jgi:hypothetical protein